ncbi:hypothetical protein ALQ35_05737 [Pseudomonas fluorescens]|nr:hypothetical protein ALQ35_05737 [Pseudomonas fluorescens]
MRHERTVRHRHTFGQAGGAGGVDHVGEVVAVECDLWIGVVNRGPGLGLINRKHCQALRNRQPLLHRRVGQQQLGAAVLHHVQQAITRVLHVQRHIHATRFHHREERHHDLGTARHGDGHAHFRAHATGDQRMRQAIGLAIEFPVGQRLRSEFYRHCIRVFPGTVGDQLVHQALGRVTRIGAIPQLQNLLLLCSVQQRQLAEGLLRVGNHALQQVLPMPGHTAHSVGFKQVLGIPQGGPDALGGFLNIQVQVEMRGLALPVQPFDPQLRQLMLNLGLAHIGLVVEHHLEQRVVAQAALRLQRFHQLLERQVLVSLRIQGALARVLQQLRDAHLAMQVSLEHLGVNEKADQALGLAAIAVGNRHADADLFLATVAVQQGLERCQQQHEQRHALLLGQRLEVAGQWRCQLDRQARATVALHRWAWVVEWQLQHALLTAQHLAPIRQLTGFLARVHPVALPHRVVGVLDRQFRQLHALPLAVSSVKLHQLLHHQLHRPTIGHDVMLNQHQHMLVIRQTQQGHTQQRPLLQFKRLGDFSFDARLEVGFLDIGTHHRQ